MPINKVMAHYFVDPQYCHRDASQNFHEFYQVLQALVALKKNAGVMLEHVHMYGFHMKVSCVVNDSNIVLIPSSCHCHCHAVPHCNIVSEDRS